MLNLYGMTPYCRLILTGDIYILSVIVVFLSDFFFFHRLFDCGYFCFHFDI